MLGDCIIFWKIKAIEEIADVWISSTLCPPTVRNLMVYNLENLLRQTEDVVWKGEEEDAQGGG